MPISDWVERLGRAVFESPFGSMESADLPELAEIRLCILDEVKARSHRVARRLVFPCNRVRVTLCGVPETQTDVFKGRFFAEYCRDELCAGLTRANTRFPADLEVEVETTPELPPEGGKWVLVDARVESKPEAPEETPTMGRLIVTKGQANCAELPLSKSRTNIGRTAEVYRTDGPSRKNDLAFEDTGETNRSVSREHAHILLDRKTGQYRLFNDRWDSQHCGVWVIRDGLSQAVRRDARGFLLRDEDEIHLGRAVLKFVTG